MKEKESRERCFQNAMGMLTVVNQWLPKQNVQLSVMRTRIELTLFFNEKESELMDTIVAMLEPIKLEWADYSENFYGDHGVYSACYTWEIID